MFSVIIREICFIFIFSNITYCLLHNTQRPGITLRDIQPDYVNLTVQCLGQHYTAELLELPGNWGHIVQDKSFCLTMSEHLTLLFSFSNFSLYIKKCWSSYCFLQKDMSCMSSIPFWFDPRKQRYRQNEPASWTLCLYTKSN